LPDATSDSHGKWARHLQNEEATRQAADSKHPLWKLSSHIPRQLQAHVTASGFR